MSLETRGSFSISLRDWMVVPSEPIFLLQLAVIWAAWLPPDGYFKSRSWCGEASWSYRVVTVALGDKLRFLVPSLRHVRGHEAMHRFPNPVLSTDNLGL